MRKLSIPTFSLNDDSPNHLMYREMFLAKTEGEAVTLRLGLNVKASILGLSDKIKTVLTSGDLTSTSSDRGKLHGCIGEREILVTLDISDRQYDDWGDPVAHIQEHMTEKDVRSFIIEITGHRDDATTIFRLLNAAYGHDHYPQIRWWYDGAGRGPENKVLFMPPLETQILPEFYPDVGDPYAYMKAYLADEAAVLLLAGEPGTGKTTFLRHMICDFKLSAHIVYDEGLMRKDQVFQSFLFDRNSDLLIIEDADTILSSRETDGNKLMARFLNVSDGLIKLPDKKLVFTTNLSDFNRIDSALVRPGRCFGQLHTRKLNLPEAQAAAKAAGLPIPTAKGEYTLAELFNQGHKPVKLRRAGF